MVVIFLGFSLERKMDESQPHRMSTTGEFMSRMEGDTQARRREKFINELSANPPPRYVAKHRQLAYRPPCLEPLPPPHVPLRRREAP